MSVFQNRTTAGQQLAERFNPRECKDAVLVAIPNGGIPVALPLADRLQLPLHLCFVAKISSPDDPRVGIGAVYGHGIYYNYDLMEVLGLRFTNLGQSIETAFRTVRNRERVFLSMAQRWDGFSLPEIEDKTVILVDDGLATGYTARVAISRLAAWDPHQVVVATPVCSRYAPAAFDRTDVPVELVTLVEDPSPVFMVDEHYADFPPLSDDEAFCLWQAHPLTKHAYAPSAKRPSFAVPWVPLDLDLEWEDATTNVRDLMEMFMGCKRRLMREFRVPLKSIRRIVWHQFCRVCNDFEALRKLPEKQRAAEWERLLVGIRYGRYGGKHAEDRSPLYWTLVEKHGVPRDLVDRIEYGHLPKVLETLVSSEKCSPPERDVTRQTLFDDVAAGKYAS